MIQQKNVLIIAGTWKNSGKTTLACRVIQMIKEKNIVAIKISPHGHDNPFLSVEIFRNKHFIIYEELEAGDEKDSRRMKAAGAKKVYYMQCPDEYLSEAIKKIPELEIESSTPVLCESGALRNHLFPGIFFMVQNADNPQIKGSSLPLLTIADLLIEFNNGNFNFDFSQISFSEGCWRVNSK